MGETATDRGTGAVSAQPRLRVGETQRLDHKLLITCHLLPVSHPDWSEREPEILPIMPDCAEDNQIFLCHYFRYLLNVCNWKIH